MCARLLDAIVSCASAQHAGEHSTLARFPHQSRRSYSCRIRYDNRAAVGPHWPIRRLLHPLVPGPPGARACPVANVNR